MLRCLQTGEQYKQASAVQCYAGFGVLNSTHMLHLDAYKATALLMDLSVYGSEALHCANGARLQLLSSGLQSDASHFLT